MSTMYCKHCERLVEAKRKIGVGTLILVIITAGFWLPVIFFYDLRCAICQGNSLSSKNRANDSGAPSEILGETKKASTDTKNCPFCAEEILAAAIKCKHCGSSLS